MLNYVITVAISAFFLVALSMMSIWLPWEGGTAPVAHGSPKPACWSTRSPRVVRPLILEMTGLPSSRILRMAE